MKTLGKLPCTFYAVALLFFADDEDTHLLSAPNILVSGENPLTDDEVFARAMQHWRDHYDAEKHGPRSRWRLRTQSFSGRILTPA